VDVMCCDMSMLFVDGVDAATTNKETMGGDFRISCTRSTSYSYTLFLVEDTARMNESNESNLI
jgi:hypothetical protein